MIAPLLWLSAGLLALFMSEALTTTTDTAVRAISILTLIFGALVFLRHGGPQITAAGLFCAATAAFVGYAGVWWADRLAQSTPPAMLQAVSAGYFVMVLMYYGFWHATRHPAAPVERDRPTTTWALVFGFIMTVTALVIISTIPASPTVYFITEAASFVGTLILAFGATGATRFRVLSVRALTVAGMIAAFVVFGFDGFGRLPVIGLAAAVALIFSMRLRTRLVKLLAVIATPIAATILTTLRSDRFGAASEIDSDVAGLWTFMRLIQLGDGLDFANGRTMLSTVLIWVPRAWWPSKPVGMETEIVWLLEPQLSNTGHSMVATIYGEWYYNFGWWGVALMAIPVGLAIRWIDRKRMNIVASALDSRVQLLVGVLVVAVMATILDLVWSSSYAFASRMLLRAIIVGALIVLFGAMAATRRAQPTRQVATMPPSFDPGGRSQKRSTHA